MFYLFGLFLVWTAYKLAKDDDMDGDHYDQPRIVTYAQTHLPVTDKWNGVKLSVRENGKKLYTPMFIVVLSLGMTDLLFALDSIPAIYGLTKEPYLVFTANVFALMGLRQLYFLIGDLLKRLVYLSYGLAVLLAFIGVKLILHALHENDAAVHQRRPPRHVGAGDPDLALAGGDHRHPGRDDGPSLAKDARDRRAAARSGIAACPRRWLPW